ncbi:hypothetical protein [Arthrobacter sp. Soil762]|uniref:hypothetical protein n=1 Tax=Arthrobacter sp. Soil762 TaxID=1736401 RepID=UPI0006F855DE|nr:hypothetical protein [Arthrobacter sp. Soil762]KRE72585.1 hypothetical protein ASG77_07905 [Arthrobacter sp. Soil762]
MGKDVIHSDVELFLTGHIRARLAAIAADGASPHSALADGVFVSDRFPDPRRSKAVVVRDDGGPTTGLNTRETTVGITVLAGDDPTNGTEVSSLALLVQAIVAGSAAVEAGNPVAVVRSTAGPFKVREDSGQPRRYFTADLGLTGQAFTA